MIRRLAYPQTNIFLLCFNLVDQISFQNVKEKWVPELREFAPKVPIILVGLQSDERNVHPMKNWSQGSQKSKPINRPLITTKSQLYELTFLEGHF